MALTRIGKAFDFLSEGGITAKTINKRFSSEVEVVGGDGELLDVIYTGGETSTTNTEIGPSIGELDAASIATIRTRVDFSNEDVARTQTETLNFGF